MAIKSVVKEDSIEAIPNQQLIINDEFIYPFESSESTQQIIDLPPSLSTLVRNCFFAEPAKVARALTGVNKGRQYIGCSRFPKTNACDFFEWQESKTSIFPNISQLSNSYRS